MGGHQLKGKECVLLWSFGAGDMSTFFHTQEKSRHRTESTMITNLFTVEHAFLFDRIFQLSQFDITVVADRK